MSDTSDGNINPLKPVSNAGDTSRKPVKSTAVVKYSAVQSPATFAQLQCNTNLNHPPSNWLSSSAESYGLQSVWSQNSGFSSFRMAHMFPDCVGEVDVVSDAENIKKLLKMPYSQGVVSMMVHRIENTLLLDDFDIHKYLLRQAQTDWEWLKEFFYQHIFHDSNDKDKRLFHKGNSRNSLQQKNLNSKFLYHSLVLADGNDSHDEDKPSLPLNTLDPSLPEPTNEEKLPDPNHNHKFARNVVWTFETIQMLIGTDMPIFGGKTHPCISLRLRDVNKPINVLTGIDYWLDNLMCNVPEVVMCYHLDGIVQKYELIKTEDLPNLEDAKFSPKVIRDVAQNILSFLKSNATKAGHTYWLFKGKDDDVVKLYDLTSLCTDMSDEKGQNPFTVPVAMLLYRVARNMKYSSDNRGHQGTIRMLLKNCVQLLNREKYPQIVTSAHYMLSDLYIPADTDPAAPLLVDEGEDEDSPSESGMSQPENCEGPAENDGEASATIKSLTLAHIKDESETENTKYKPLPVSGTLVERCRAALDHVSDGLDCLEYFPTVDQCDEDEKKSKDDASSSMAEENLNTAKSFEAIPMPYSPLNTEQKSENIVEDTCSSPSQKKKLKKKLKKERARKDSVNKELVDTSPRALLCKSKVDTLPTWQAPRKSDNSSWKSHLKTLLYEKASLVLSVLAEYEYTNQRYGACLRHILAVLGCQKILEVFCGQKNDKLISCLLGRAGDSCLMVVQDWKNIEIHRDCYQVKDAIEEKLVSEIFKQNDLDMNGAELIPEALDSLETTLVASYKCYEKALELEPQNGGKNNLLPRLGNIHNELGVLYMNQAASKYQQNDAEESSDATNLLTKSLTHLMAGVKAFESVRDEANLALLHSNTGRLMRLCAHMHVKKQTQERHFYNKAVASYQKALQVLGNRKTNTSIWDTVTWELSTTLFTMATLLQDYPTSGNKTEEELERDVVDLLQKSLKYCDTETPGPRQPVYQFRVATIQHRLASLYHRVYRELESDSECIRRKTSLQLSKMYYDKAAKLFMSLEQPLEFLTVQIERVALSEHQAQTSATFNGKLKAYQHGIELILQCQPILDLLVEKLKASKAVQGDDSDPVKSHATLPTNENPDQLSDERKQSDDEEKLVLLLHHRLQYLLKSLTKLFLGKQTSLQSKKELEYLANLYKMCYSQSLKCGGHSGLQFVQEINLLIQDIAPKLCEVQEIH